VNGGRRRKNREEDGFSDVWIVKSEEMVKNRINLMNECPLGNGAQVSRLTDIFACIDWLTDISRTRWRVING
jgi:hypothetical protein